MSFIESLQKAKADVIQQRAHPWAARLHSLRGRVDHDGVERITTQAVFDALEVPQDRRTSAACLALARVMRSLGWTSVRVRGLTRGGYREQVRGYARDTSPGRRLRSSDCRKP